MSGYYADRYGIPGKTISNLYCRYRTRIKGDSTFESFDDFLRWVSGSGYRKGCWIVKKNESLPHGWDNSDLVEIIRTRPAPVKTEPTEEQSKEEPEAVRNFCENCSRKGLSCQYNDKAGCKSWQENFERYWNKYIHREVKLPEKKPEKKAKEYFRYEHPDLVREGIVFENRQSISEKEETE